MEMVERQRARASPIWSPMEPGLAAQFGRGFYPGQSITYSGKFATQMGDLSLKFLGLVPVLFDLPRRGSVSYQRDNRDHRNTKANQDANTTMSSIDIRPYRSVCASRSEDKEAARALMPRRSIFPVPRMGIAST